jgi:hypothetical protein
VIGGDSMPGARHILDDKGGVAGDVLSNVACKRAGIDIKAAAGRCSDDDADRLTGEESRLSRKQRLRHHQ